MFTPLFYTGLSNGYELKALINWTLMIIVWIEYSQEMRKLIIKEGVHIQLLIKLIDLPHASTAHQDVCYELYCITTKRKLLFI